MNASITVAAVGDVAPLWPLSEQTTRAEAWQPLRDADLAMANLELPLTDRIHGGHKAFNLRAAPQVADTLRACGIDLVSVANNHALDFGPEGLCDTLTALRKANIVPVGGGRDLEEALSPAFTQVGGLTVATIGLACTLPTGFAAGPGRASIAPVRAESRFYIDAMTLDEQPGMAPWVETRVVDHDLARARELVERTRARGADLVIIQIHWGIPHGWCGAFQGPLADYQRPLGHALIDAGADLVLGHHPHAVHGVERHRRGVIVYSLSHFLFHAMGNQARIEQTTSYPHYDMASVSTGSARDTVLLEAEASVDGLGEVRLTPARLDDRGEPVLLTAQTGEVVLQRLARDSAVLDTTIEVRDGHAVVGAALPVRATTSS